jgi:hypothetical protein
MKETNDENRFIATITVADLKKTFSELLTDNALIKANTPQQPLVKIDDNDELIPRITLAERHHCTVETIDKHVKVGILPKPIYIGALKYFFKRDLDDFYAKQRKLNNLPL